MRTRIYYPFILLIALLTTVSCENELPFSVKDNPPKLVMNALINADSLTNVLYLNFTGRGYATHAEKATVEVRVNGQLSESLRPLPPQTEGDMQCRFHISSKFTPIPMTKYYYTQNFLRYKINIKDRSNEDNYYRLIMDKQMTVKDYNEETGEFVSRTIHRYHFISREDIVLTDGQPTNSDDEDNGMFDTVKNIYGVFDDSRFKNTSYTMTVYNQTDIDGFPEYGTNVKMDIIVRLLSITETEYYYLKALNLVDSDAYDETINEPIKYPSNVHGGIGMIGISTETSKIIHIEKPQR